MRIELITSSLQDWCSTDKLSGQNVNNNLHIILFDFSLYSLFIKLYFLNI